MASCKEAPPPGPTPPGVSAHHFVESNLNSFLEIERLIETRSQTYQLPENSRSTNTQTPFQGAFHNLGLNQLYLMGQIKDKSWMSKIPYRYSRFPSDQWRLLFLANDLFFVSKIELHKKSPDRPFDDYSWFAFVDRKKISKKHLEGMDSVNSNQRLKYAESIQDNPMVASLFPSFLPTIQAVYLSGGAECYLKNLGKPTSALPGMAEKKHCFEPSETFREIREANSTSTTPPKIVPHVPVLETCRFLGYREKNTIEFMGYLEQGACILARNPASLESKDLHTGLVCFEKTRQQLLNALLDRVQFSIPSHFKNTFYFLESFPTKARVHRMDIEGLSPVYQTSQTSDLQKAHPLQTVTDQLVPFSHNEFGLYLCQNEVSPGKVSTEYGPLYVTVPTEVAAGVRGVAQDADSFFLIQESILEAKLNTKLLNYTELVTLLPQMQHPPHPSCLFTKEPEYRCFTATAHLAKQILNEFETKFAQTSLNPETQLGVLSWVWAALDTLESLGSNQRIYSWLGPTKSRTSFWMKQIYQQHSNQNWNEEEELKKLKLLQSSLFGIKGGPNLSAVPRFEGEIELPFHPSYPKRSSNTQ